MGIDFHSEKNRYTYSSRDADASWAQAITSVIAPAGARVADIGCGGGIYAMAWRALGAQSVTGVDFSEQMVAAAREKAAGLDHIEFKQGTADATGLASLSVDVVFQRGLIHHLKNYDSCFLEANRLLVPNGHLLVQDRTPEDVLLPGAAEHIRGYFLERFPRLRLLEVARRPTYESVEKALRRNGFGQVRRKSFWEVRRTYENFESLAQDLAARTGRSILHELSDTELEDLIEFIGAKIGHTGPLVEKDCWTLWSATKNA
ncbi:TPA: class I SAM-dependent methyltransferase [Pseudomonas aeruginosa]|uniref:class I SAM-dependent methyltransferase n=1 Tax=Pseudomonas aeruginosa TaxID=287 RepID=UPI000E31FF49|nr:class I SAM-dependent methyltransferase [Pseudomonas aeruginosa]NPX94481.1 class I SAM-dependent methyltransferase [Pseudomonas aeruginosa]